VTNLSTVIEGGLGTPVFAAPEQLREGDAADERSDVYSLGRVLHFMLIEKSPGIELGKELELRNLRDLPPGIVEVVRRATQHLPSRRFVNAKLMLDALERSLTGAAARAAIFGDMRRWIVRKLLLPTMLVITVSTISFALSESSRAQREQDLGNEARAAAQELADAGKELARLTEQLRDFQSAATTLVSKKDHLVASIAMLNIAVNNSKTSTKDRARFKEELATDQKDLAQVNAQIADIQAQQRRLQDEVIAAEARVMRQVSVGRPMQELPSAPSSR
jgi:serine/threonine protein kinase